MINFLYKNGRKGHQRSNQQWHYTCIEDYYLCGKFHGFMKKCQFWGLYAAILYITETKTFLETITKTKKIFTFSKNITKTKITQRI